MPKNGPDVSVCSGSGRITDQGNAGGGGGGGGGDIAGPVPGTPRFCGRGKWAVEDGGDVGMPLVVTHAGAVSAGGGGS